MASRSSVLIGHVEKQDPKDGKEDVPNDKEQTFTYSSESYSSSKGKNKSSTGEKIQDHYALLGLSHLRYLASEDQIWKSYRDAAVRHPPDKLASLLLAEETEAGKQAKKEEIENHFKAIQEAYEVLIDPVRRRIYDSTDEFDDEIPTECAPQDFFKVFGPAFLRNGRWSVTQPLPSLGDENTPIKEVDSFYNFWYSFKSWREFPRADEFDLEQAESRDHKRWMERQNAKLSEKARKEESARIRTLVHNAYLRDPRILGRKEAEKAEKQRKKEAKILAKKLQEEEAARIVEEEKRKKEEEGKKATEAALQQKKLKDKEKKLLRKERSRLRTLAAPVLSQHFLGLTDGDVEGLCMSLDIEQLKNLCDKLDGKGELVIAELLREALGHEHNLKYENKDENRKAHQNGSLEGKRQVPLMSSEIKGKPWSKEEIDLLRKGMLKYPKGTSRRWEVISEYIGTARTVEEILKATKTVLLQKPDSAKAFAPEAARIVEEEKRKKEEGKKAALQQKKLKDKEKKLLRKERSRLRTLAAPVLSQHLLGLTDDDVEGLCMSLDIEQLKNLCDKLDGKGELVIAELLREALGHEHNLKYENKDENSKSRQNGKPWSKEEIDLLRKGMLKYPKGTSRRWKVISEYIGTARTVEEILKATKTVLLQNPDSAKAFDSFLEKRKPAPTIASPLSTRAEVEGLENSSKPESGSAKLADSQESPSQNTSSQTTGDAPAANGVSSSSDSDIWSAVQEKALVQALKTFPKETSQRWERVATAVPGKTMNQCRRKFALLRENFRNKKSAV